MQSEAGHAPGATAGAWAGLEAEGRALAGVEESGLEGVGLEAGVAVSGEEATGGDVALGKVEDGLLSGDAGMGVGVDADKAGVASGVAGGVATAVDLGVGDGPNRVGDAGVPAGTGPGAGAGPVPQALFCVGQLRVQVPLTAAA